MYQCLYNKFPWKAGSLPELEQAIRTTPLKIPEKPAVDDKVI